MDRTDSVNYFVEGFYVRDYGFDGPRFATRAKMVCADEERYHGVKVSRGEGVLVTTGPLFDGLRESFTKRHFHLVSVRRMARRVICVAFVDDEGRRAILSVEVALDTPTSLLERRLIEGMLDEVARWCCRR